MLPAQLGPTPRVQHASSWLSIATDRARPTTPRHGPQRGSNLNRRRGVSFSPAPTNADTQVPWAVADLGPFAGTNEEPWLDSPPLAMQKVQGSSPFSRSLRGPAYEGLLSLYGRPVLRRSPMGCSSPRLATTTRCNTSVTLPSHADEAPSPRHHGDTSRPSRARRASRRDGRREDRAG